jgi:hypothetical protein
VYESSPLLSGDERVAVLHQEELAALPETLLRELSDALTSLDVERISKLILQVSEQDAELGGRLASFADRFEYSPLLRALGSYETNVSEQRA